MARMAGFWVAGWAVLLAGCGPRDGERQGDDRCFGGRPAPTTTQQEATVVDGDLAYGGNAVTVMETRAGYVRMITQDGEVTVTMVNPPDGPYRRSISEQPSTPSWPTTQLEVRHSKVVGGVEVTRVWLGVSGTVEPSTQFLGEDEFDVHTIQAVLRLTPEPQAQVVGEMRQAPRVEAVLRFGVTPQPPSNCDGRNTPLVLDLNHNGQVDLTSVVGSTIRFDVGANGLNATTAWLAAGESMDGFLALDRNGNGVVDDGRELFGNQHHAANGFEELRRFDTNQDGVINAGDPVFSVLHVWRDHNGNGHSEPHELVRLTQLGVASIPLSYAQDDALDRHGNGLFQRGSFTWTGGTTSPVVDAWLVTRTHGMNW